MIKINVEYDYNYEIHLSSLSPIEFALYEKDVTSYLKGLTSSVRTSPRHLTCSLQTRKANRNMYGLLHGAFLHV